MKDVIENGVIKHVNRETGAEFVAKCVKDGGTFLTVDDLCDDKFENYEKVSLRQEADRLQKDAKKDLQMMENLIKDIEKQRERIAEFESGPVKEYFRKLRSDMDDHKKEYSTELKKLEEKKLIELKDREDKKAFEASIYEQKVKFEEFTEKA